MRIRHPTTGIAFRCRTSLECQCNGLKGDFWQVEVLLNRVRHDVLHISTVLVDEVVGERWLRQRVRVCSQTTRNINRITARYVSLSRRH